MRLATLQGLIFFVIGNAHHNSRCDRFDRIVRMQCRGSEPHYFELESQRYACPITTLIRRKIIRFVEFFQFLSTLVFF
jgi:hypothetical protein